VFTSRLHLIGAGAAIIWLAAIVVTRLTIAPRRAR
jgi:hypothetical protein